MQVALAQPADKVAGNADPGVASDGGGPGAA
jgi:hypothetical protein